MNDLLIKIQNLFTQQHSNNQNAQQNIQKINQLLAENRSIAPVLAQLKNWQGDASLAIQNYSFWLILSISILLLLLGFAIHPLFLIVAGLGIAFAFHKRTSTKTYNQMLEYIQQRNLEEKYQILFNYNDENFNIESPYHFPYFGLGDHKNEIRNCIYGCWSVKGVNYPFMLYNYHYVDKVTTRDAEGKTKTEYRQHDLWGIILENFPIQGISIASKQKYVSRLGVKWSSGDIRFDNQYQLSGTNEMILAKFFKPNHVLVLDQAMQAFKGDFYVQAHRPSLCWLFDVDITQREIGLSSIHTVQDLVMNLESTTMPNLEQLRQSMTDILKEVQSHANQQAVI